jgi:hypothetical protein
MSAGGVERIAFLSKAIGITEENAVWIIFVAEGRQPFSVSG